MSESLREQIAAALHPFTCLDRHAVGTLGRCIVAADAALAVVARDEARALIRLARAAQAPDDPLAEAGDVAEASLRDALGLPARPLPTEPSPEGADDA